MIKRNKLSLILFLSILSFGAYQLSFAEDNEVKLLPPIQTQEINLDTSVDEALQNTAVKEVITPKVEDIKEMTPNANEQVKNEVVQDTKNHLNSVIKKFLAAMAGVVISSIIIFILASFMNKVNFIKKRLSGKPEEFFDEPEIPISNDENEALKIFFDKTK